MYLRSSSMWGRWLGSLVRYTYRLFKGGSSVPAWLRKAKLIAHNVWRASGTIVWVFWNVISLAKPWNWVGMETRKAGNVSTFRGNGKNLLSLSSRNLMITRVVYKNPMNCGKIYNISSAIYKCQVSVISTAHIFLKWQNSYRGTLLLAQWIFLFLSYLVWLVSLYNYSRTADVNWPNSHLLKLPTIQSCNNNSQKCHIGILRSGYTNTACW